MATLRGILGQARPGTGVLDDIYTVPASKNATLRVIATNLSNIATKFRVALAPAGAADSLEQYIAYDVALAGNDTGSTVSVMVDATDIVRVYSQSGNVAFSAVGIEQDQ